MSLYRFEMPSIAQARAVLANTSRQAEFLADRLAAQRRLTPVTSEAERTAARAFRASARPDSSPCTACRRFAFPRPTLCYWCAAARRPA